MTNTGNTNFTGSKTPSEEVPSLYVGGGADGPGGDGGGAGCADGYGGGCG